MAGVGRRNGRTDAVNTKGGAIFVKGPKTKSAKEDRTARNTHYRRRVQFRIADEAVWLQCIPHLYLHVIFRKSGRDRVSEVFAVSDAIRKKLLPAT